MPTNRIPEVGDTFVMDGYDEEEGGQTLSSQKIIEVGDPIVDGDHEGRSVLLEDGIWYDCFWSDVHQWFQYFADPTPDA